MTTMTDLLDSYIRDHARTDLLLVRRRLFATRQDLPPSTLNHVSECLDAFDLHLQEHNHRLLLASLYVSEGQDKPLPPHTLTARQACIRLRSAARNIGIRDASISDLIVRLTQLINTSRR